MDDRVWDKRYAAAELIWTAEPNRFLVAEVNGSAPGRAPDSPAARGATPSGSRLRDGR